jgi:CDP-4-dehydro-6-deoxyglucose reductase
MTAHVRVRPSGREFLVDGDDTLLEAALRAGLALDYGCASGSCGKCKARLVSGEAHRARHSDYPLSAAEKNAGVLLLCCHTAATDLVIEAREARGPEDMPLQTIDARVKSVGPLGEGVRLLHLQTPRSNRLRFLAGQSACLSLGAASAWLPIASCPCDERNLQFHVRRRDGDAFAERVFAGLEGVDTVRVEGPRGKFVLREDSDRPLVFIAGEGGFAPVKSLIEHAMALDTAESLDLCWSAGADGHYLDNLCRSWGDALDNFRYHPVATPAALWQVLSDHPRLADCDVYVAGPAPWADELEFRLLEVGVPQAQLRISTLAA